MHISQVLCLGLSTFALLDGVVGLPRPANNGNKGGNNGGNGNGNNNNGGNNNNNNNGGNGNADTLLTANIQSNSASDGNPDTGAGQAASQTDPANFINICSGKTLANGAQDTGGACEGTTMGDLPAKNNMVSTIITNPKPGDDLQANQDFDVTLQVANLNAGVFTNPDTTYYAAPQGLQGGNIIGHVHVTIQDLGGQTGNLAPNQAPDASTFAFFKGIDDAGDGKGGLKATVAGGLPAGNYRVCTMSSAANHQPVLMPVAQRGAQDDCTKFTVGAGGGNNNNNNGGGNNNNNNGGQNGANNGNGNGANNNGNQNGAGNSQTSTTTSAAGSTNTGAANNNGGQRGGSGKDRGNQNGGQQASTTTSAAGTANTGSANNNGVNQQTSATTSAASSTNTGAANGNGNGSNGDGNRGGRGGNNRDGNRGGGGQRKHKY